MRFVIVTGMSGAGKSTALKMLEDMGYFCVDNLPIQLMPKFAEMLMLPAARPSMTMARMSCRVSPWVIQSPTNHSASARV